MYCEDHKEPCCALCACTQHRKCDTVVTIETAAENIRKSDAMQVLIAEMKSQEKKLVNFCKAHEENVTEIENLSDMLTGEAEKLEEDIVNHIGQLKNRYLDKLSKLTKESKERINKDAEDIQDKTRCVEKCRQTL
jgi:phage host-nuclease inhibitor protein Gam